jgi:hypothetical protein
MFCYPRLGRFGLGNCLLPWARAVVFARTHSLPILGPQWVQPRLGAVLRREKVNRFYFNEISNRDYIKGLRKWLILVRAAQVNEDEAVRVISCGHKTGNRSTVVVFQGMRDLFRDLWHHHQIIHEELHRIVARTILEKVASIREPFVAMHVRRGDIITPGLTEAQLMAKKHYTPLTWFVAAAKAIRAEASFRTIPIYVVSDGYEHELAELLAIPNCCLKTLGSAIGDILLLSKATLLFATAHSTFSMWGSYLGRMPTLYYPGKLDQNVFPPDSGIPEREWSTGQALPRSPAR